jgi:Skp family chaperone for outer membrane proteins
MKTTLFSSLLVCFVFAVATSASAQTTTTTKQTTQTPAIKIGMFDIDQMVMAMPGYAAVDSALQNYQADSLGIEYEILQNEYRRLDSTYKIDSANKKSKPILDYTAQQRQQVAIKLVYWQQYAQQRLENKRAQLAQPLYVQVVNAYKKILDTKKYTVVLKPDAFEQGTDFKVVDNIFELVAKELKIKLPTNGGDEAQQ